MRTATTHRRVALLAVVFVAATFVSGSTLANAASFLDVEGGRTVIEPTAETGRQLIGAGIVPVAFGGAELVGGSGTPRVATLPVVDGSFERGSSAGDATHMGGVRLVAQHGLRSVTISDPRLVVDPADPRVIVTVDREPPRQVAMWRADLSRVELGGDGVGELRIRGIRLELTPAGAAVLNEGLRTSTFVAGTTFGTAGTTLAYTLSR
jgi:hypothetical protein